MAALPRISGLECIKALSRNGWECVSIRGSHAKLSRLGYRSLIVPLHPELDRGTLRAIIHQAGLTVEEFVRLL